MENFQTLIPFPGAEGTDSALARYRVLASVRSSSAGWTFRFRVEGTGETGISELILPRFAGGGARRDELWKTTCFEVFVADPRSREYVEWNGSANGDWNCYRFDDYRAGMRLADPDGEPPVYREVFRDAGAWEGEWKVPRALLPFEGPIGLAAVTETRAQGQSSLAYWAAAHFSVRPDFHRRESFVCRIEASGRNSPV